MRVDAFAVRLRPRSPFEAADLGTRLCQQAARDVYPCVLLACVPIGVVAAMAGRVSPWLAATAIWWSKPWLDRTILFVLARAAFGQRTSVADLWRNQRQVWWRHLLHTLTLRRLSPWRSLTQPVYQLEGLPLFKSGNRVSQIRRRKAGAALLVSGAYMAIEILLMFGVIGLLLWMTPEAEMPALYDFADGTLFTFLGRTLLIAYALVVPFLEPFYVASGFAIYLGRRAELEAWDIEQEFRRAFAADAVQGDVPDRPRNRRRAFPLLLLAMLLSLPRPAAAQTPPQPSQQEIDAALAEVKADPNLGGSRTITLPRWQSSAGRTDLSWLRWFVQLMRYLAQSSRAVLYVGLFAAALALLVYFVRTLAGRERRQDGDRLITPTHVRDLDIRPESLPADIGAAARHLWDSAQHRAALALLYRGLLSRLAHVHRLAIRDSTTEGDCLALARTHLNEDRHQYSARLVRVWQRAVYGGTDPEAVIVYDLCDAFAGTLDQVTPAARVTT